MARGEVYTFFEKGFRIEQEPKEATAPVLQIYQLLPTHMLGSFMLKGDCRF